MQALTSYLRLPGLRAGVVLPSNEAREKKHQPRIKSGVTFAVLTALIATPAHAATGEPVNPWVALAYLVSGVLFILALRWRVTFSLSSRRITFPETRYFLEKSI